MRRAMVSIGLFVALAGCPSPEPTNITNFTNSTVVTPPLAPLEPLPAEPVCVDRLSRAEWLVCTDPKLNTLHRQLASQWAAARQGASPERLDMLDNQLYALTSELELCGDAACVTTAYRRYLNGPVAVPPSTTPPKRVKPVKAKYVPHKKRERHHGWKGDNWYRGAGEQSCLAEAGSATATQLARQCDQVSGARGGQCSVKRSCEDLKAQIDQGCWNNRNKPAFCKLH